MKHCCEEMRMMVEEENSIVWAPRFREYGVPIRDGGTSFLVMEYCPWCGAKLPESLRDEYFDILEKAGIDYPCPLRKLPEVLRSERWWQEDERFRHREADVPSGGGDASRK